MNDDITGNDDDSKDRDKWHPPIDPAPTAALVAEVNQLLEETEDVEAAVIIDQRGLPIVSAPPGNIDESRLTTTGVSLVALGQRAMQGAGRGNPTHVLTEGPDGQVILMFAGDRAALLVLAGHRIAPGPLLSRMRQVSDRIASHMQDPRTQPPPTGDG